MKHNTFGALVLASICSLLFLAIIGGLSLARADHDDEQAAPKPPPFMLMLTVHTPGRQPDSHRNIPMQNLDECWESAKAFIDGLDVPEGALGISAACGKSAQPKVPENPA